MGLLAHAKEWICQGCRPSTALLQMQCWAEGRSPKWPALRRKFLQRNPTCAACGTTECLEVHHCVPFHIDSAKELDPRNLLTLCEGDKRDHF